MQGDILEDIALIENLEETKRTSLDIAEKVVQARDTGERLGRAREVISLGLLACAAVANALLAEVGLGLSDGHLCFPYAENSVLTAQMMMC